MNPILKTENGIRAAISISPPPASERPKVAPKVAPKKLGRRVKAILPLMAALLALIGVSGCATVASDQDVLVVRAEQLAAQSFTVCDQFLAWEKANQATAGQSVHEYAEGLRRNGPTLFKTLRSVTRVYKSSRTAENKATLETMLAVVEKLLSEAQSHLLKLGAVKAAAPVMAVAPMVVVALLELLMSMFKQVAGMVAEAKRTKEWTPAQEAEIDAKMASGFLEAHWEPEVEKDEQGVALPGAKKGLPGVGDEGVGYRS